uniref:Ig-like domain-containing protein n=1 Tax=Chelydra serpentina TaxID=8475 RepID=A0A8C3XND9_CHESE
VTQTEGSATICEGEPVLLNCTYQTTGYPTLFWYVRYGNQAPRLFLRDGSADPEEGNRKDFSADHQDRTYHLRKLSGQLSDSGVYYCAMSPTASHIHALAAQKPIHSVCQQQLLSATQAFPGWIRPVQKQSPLTGNAQIMTQGKAQKSLNWDNLALWKISP